MSDAKWGEYSLESLFEITGTKSLDSNAIEFIEEGINFVGRTFEDNGVQGKIKKRDYEPNEPYTITATVIGNYKYVKYQTEPYYCSQNINKLKPKPVISVWNKYVASFFVANIQKFVEQYNHQQGGYKLEDIKAHKIHVPIKDGSIDFDLIVSYMREIEAEQITGLIDFLKENELDNSNLSKVEQKYVRNLSFAEINRIISAVSWKEYRIGDLFERIDTKKLPYKAKDLPIQPQDEYRLPCLTSSFKNQGLNYYAPENGATILKEVISIPSNSDVYRAYFQPHDFTVLSDSYAIKWKYDDSKIDCNQYLFFVTSINNVTDLPIYSYKNKLGGWNTVKNKMIMLPCKDNEIDMELMSCIVKLIKKELLQGVVQYANMK